MKYRHTPVLVNEVLENIPFRPGIRILDCNLGEGGHSSLIAKEIIKSGGGTLIGLERDEKIFKKAEKNLREYSDIIKIVNENFVNLDKVLNKLSIFEIDVILFDLGISSFHYFDDDRGFSFMDEQKLDMRLDKTCEYSASDILNSFEERKIAEIIKEYGEERFAKRIARNVIKVRQDETILKTEQLVEIVKMSIPRKFWPKHISPATKTFQALRIYVNSELENLKNVLPKAFEILNKGGRLLVISFHSLEDRIVKRFMNEMSKKCVCPPEIPVCVCDNKPKLKVLSKRAISPTDEEIQRNKASRSAKLRVAEKL